MAACEVGVMSLHIGCALNDGLPSRTTSVTPGVEVGVALRALRLSSYDRVAYAAFHVHTLCVTSQGTQPSCGAQSGV